MSATKKNTTFNSHAQNLKEAAPPAPVKLGAEKKHTPVISVRPFVRDPTPGKVNLVAPMINGELVVKKTEMKQSSGKPASNGLMRKLSHDDSGRGEIKSMKTDSLGSDGSTENSSDSDSNMRDSPPPRPAPASSFPELAPTATKPSSTPAKSINRLSEDIKSSAAVARLSDLDKTIPPPPSITDLQAARLSLSVHSSSHEETKNAETEGKSNSKARLSFLHSTIEEAEVANSDPELSTTKPRDNAESEQRDDAAAVEPSRVDRKDETVQKTRDSPKVKLTRKSPYVCGPYASTAILKGTPKPLITRKPAVLKDKPKVPVKPNKLLMRSPSASPASREEEAASPPAPPHPATPSRHAYT